ncbi:HD domain-containing protein [Calderihabitans maritimus]|uniref:Metal-dependent phosphohydrolase n=1 Tax=Calderihabitans maritimus TaxID=1246530 RepID=A0A1Z5HPJ3_9FIRM|nr:HD domain-containing protein [Calderihabitans maritimus]GAW91434.1 metal-dependent phosphohydrolase [Calderihabitans maritimus]
MEKAFTIQEKMLAKIAEFENKDVDRDYSLNWERLHMASCTAIGKLLALKRGIDPELAAIACSVHDYGRLVTGKQKNHAAAGYEPLKEFLQETGLFTEEQTELIAQSARNHSNKNEVGSPLEELVKDADVLDCYLHGVPLEREEQRHRLRQVLEEIKLSEMLSCKNCGQGSL